jgi:hypothetical protein
MSQNTLKDERIKKEIARLLKLLQDIPEDVRGSVDSLVRNAAFMSITLEDLQQQINEKGCVSEYQNGENQWGTKKSPEVEIYNAMIRNHMGIIKQLTDLVPEDKPKPETDALIQFVKKVAR